MKIFERFFILLILIAYILKYYNVVGANSLLFFSSIILGVYYFLFSFLVFNSISLNEVFKAQTYRDMPALHGIISVYSGVIYSSLIFALLMRILGYPYGNSSLITSGICFIILFLIIIYKYSKTYKLFFREQLIRSIIYIIMFILHFFLI